MAEGLPLAFVVMQECHLRSYEFVYPVCAGLLCLWIYASGVHHPYHRDSVCDNRWDILLAEC